MGGGRRGGLRHKRLAGDHDHIVSESFSPRSHDEALHCLPWNMVPLPLSLHVSRIRLETGKPWTIAAKTEAFRSSRERRQRGTLPLGVLSRHVVLTPVPDRGPGVEAHGSD